MLKSGQVYKSMKNLLGISLLVFLASTYYSIGSNINSYSPNCIYNELRYEIAQIRQTVSEFRKEAKGITLEESI